MEGGKGGKGGRRCCPRERCGTRPGPRMRRPRPGNPREQKRFVTAPARGGSRGAEPGSGSRGAEPGERSPGRPPQLPVPGSWTGQGTDGGSPAGSVRGSPREGSAGCSGRGGPGVPARWMERWAGLGWELPTQGDGRSACALRAAQGTDPDKPHRILATQPPRMHDM